MNADLIKRLFRAINEGSETNMRKIAGNIVSAEREKGHTSLAEQLDEILNKPAPLRSNRAEGTPRSLESAVERPLTLGQTLPTSKRSLEPLVTRVPAEALRHHMVLPSQVEARFQRVENEFAARDRLAQFGLQPRHKILLYGPPGCGKSLGAERLAWTTGLPLVKVRFDAIMSSFFGESASNLRSVFEAYQSSPCLLFLDECDFVARSRTATNDVGEVPRIVNTLLQLLEDYRSPGLLVAATNLDQSLDKAIFRRFDDVFEVPLPGKEEVINLLKTTLSAIHVAPDVDWASLSPRLEGMSAANVVKAAQDAAKSAVLAGELPVRQSHFLKAIEELRRNQ
jgi:SpoVK/Ycf46/Vps4 family AAA+-type ATPase